MTIENADALRAVLTQVAADPDWATSRGAELAQAVFEAVPMMGEDEELSANVRASTVAALRLLLAMVEAGGDPAAAALPPEMLAYARDAVVRGASIELLMRSFHVAHARWFAVWTRDVRAVTDDPEQAAAAIEQGAAWTFAFVDALTSAIVGRYAEERDRWVRSAAAVRAEEVRALLAGASVEPQRASARLGYELERRHLALVAADDRTGDGGTTDLNALEGAALAAGAALGVSEPLIVPLSERALSAWLPVEADADPRATIDALAPGPASLAFGTPRAGIEGFRRSHAEALAARRVARLGVPAAGSITWYADVALLDVALADVPRARAFALDELGPLAAEDRTTVRLADTLLAYLEHQGSARRAAERLGVHENTVAYRVRAARELLARPLDTRAPELLVALRIAAALRGPAVA